MRSRNTLLLVVLLVLVGAAAYFFSNKGSDKSTLNVEESDFSVSDTASVDKIFISYKSGENHLLERKPDNTWILDKKFETQKRQVNILLETLKRMEVKRPADKASRNNVIRDFATLGRKVEIYQHGKLAKTFYVGQNTDNDLGTYFIMAGSEDPYVLHIPGFNGFISSRFDISELYWRSVPVFRSTPQTLQELSIEYTGSAADNLNIRKEGNQFAVAGLQQPNQEDVKAYLENFKFVNGEYYIPDPMKKLADSLALKTPVAKIMVKDAVPAHSRSFSLFLRPDEIDRFVALDDRSRDIISVQTYVFDRLLIRREAFGKK
ncbi:hypothetical protein [Adhaeribacter soli]|uniref:DUF4340 domain-containing protein n=1 Tax=Adhaeribacter soli TaxID=2607655 RepID=A0A5N1J6L9_9BACT|nr:hypothetical protein [Adhaeribacter soli]KAA9345773.1 hypothetical protein F0P94_01425 [Adhaeribacter soli]